MLVLNFMYMKKSLFRFSSRRILFSTVIASALIAGGSQAVFADAGEVQVVLQTGTIKGKIVDSNGEPVIGANVMVKGTTNGCMTDIDGNFSLKDAKGTLVISYIGYKTEEVQVKGHETSLKIVLKEDSELLLEVVVVGYGSMKKESLTGSVTVVDQKLFKDKGTVSNPLSAMQGQGPGLRITRPSAAPGEEGWGVSIRGSVSKNKVEPLLIIDGVPASGVSEIAQLNADDIETINFLKDASAAIYGAKAAGGVILVTTKRPDAGRTKVEYSGSVTRKIVGLQPRMMSMDEWTDGVLQARLNDGYGEDDNWVRYARLAKAMKRSWINLHGGNNPDEDPIPGGFRGVADFVFHDMNWTDVLWGNATSTQHNLSISGGSEKSTYRLSLGYLNDQGTLQWGNNSNERYNVRLFNSFKINDRISLESNMSASRQHQVAPTQIGSILGSSIPQPGLPVSTIDGKPYAWGGIHTPNWSAELGGDNKLVVTTMNVNEILKVNILDGLDFQGTLGYSTNNAARDEQYLSIDWYQYDGTPIQNENSPYPAKEKSSYTKSSARTDNYTASAFLTYKKLFDEAHDISLMGGVQYDYAAYDYSGTKAMDVEAAIESLNGKGQIYIDKVDRWEEAILSYFGRLNYNYKSRYMVEVNARYDGSSKFLPKNRWNFFWGASAGWRITEEKFMENLRDYVNELKLRASYGEVGNQNGIGRYDGIQLYNYKSNSGALLGNSKGTYVESAGLVSTVRTWERIYNYNLGIDFGFFNNRLTGTIEYYDKRTKDLIFDYTVSTNRYPYGTMTANVGEISNKGIELTINATPVVTRNFTWSTTLNISHNKNNVESLSNDTYSVNYKDYGNPDLGGYATTNVQRLMPGSPVGQFYLWEWAGYNEAGGSVFNDYDEDGNLVGTTDSPNDGDRRKAGSAQPKVTFGWNNTLNYKNWSLTAFFQGIAGNKIFNATRAFYNNVTLLNTGKNILSEVATMQKATDTRAQAPSDRYIENGSYLRLASLSLGYDFGKLGDWVNSLKIYATCNNVFTLTGYKGVDPEINLGGLQPGIDWRNTTYPRTRTFMFGVNINF